LIADALDVDHHSVNESNPTNFVDLNENNVNIWIYFYVPIPVNNCAINYYSITYYRKDLVKALK